MRFSGIVKSGKSRGKAMGFPTANMPAPSMIPDGIYIGLANKKPALIFIGASETFNDHDRHAEVYILDFMGNLYGHGIEVEIIKKIRNNMKFNTREQLIDRMKLDEAEARAYFKI
ncbi:MAG: riboflavin kinase [Candidatus Doudnabacteria bacterium]|nr:riboflavin kinase [Candidatus Doudnabacteria bacterium]